MTAVVVQQEEQDVRIPGWVCDLTSFRRWAKSDDFPDRGWYAHLNGELWVDPSMERLAHNQIKAEISIVLGALVKRAGTGKFRRPDAADEYGGGPFHRAGRDVLEL